VSRRQLPRSARQACASSDNRSAGEGNLADFALLQDRGGCRLGDIVNARAAAAPVGLGPFGQFNPGNGPQDFPRLRGDFLTMAKVTSLAVGAMAWATACSLL
jgi:hypothetical protein